MGTYRKKFYLFLRELKFRVRMPDFGVISGYNGKGKFIWAVWHDPCQTKKHGLIK